MKIPTSTEGCWEKSHIKYLENTQPKQRTSTWVLKWNLVKYFNILTSVLRTWELTPLFSFTWYPAVAVHVVLHGLCACCFYMPIIYFCTSFFFTGSLPPGKGIAFPKMSAVTQARPTGPCFPDIWEEVRAQDTWSRFTPTALP